MSVVIEGRPKCSECGGSGEYEHTIIHEWFGREDVMVICDRCGGSGKEPDEHDADGITSQEKADGPGFDR